MLILLTLFLPSFTGYFLIRKLGFNPQSAFFSALFLLTYQGGASGVFYSVIAGLLNSRLAISLFPLLVLLSIKNIFQHNEKAKLSKVLAGISFSCLLSLVLLCHPYHIFLPCIFFTILILMVKKNKIKADILSFFLLICLGFGLACFWWLPAIINRKFVSSLQIWAKQPNLISLISSFLGKTTEKIFIFIYLLTALFLLSKQNQNQEQEIRKKIALISLILTPPALFIFILFFQFVFIDIAKVYFIDPIRLKDGVYFSMILVSGIGITLLFEKLKIAFGSLKFNFSETFLKFLAYCSLFIGILYFTVIQVRTFYRFLGYRHFAFLSQLVKAHQADTLWQYLKQEEETSTETNTLGRILFTASKVNIKGLPAHFNTHIMSLTPLYTNRQIIGGVNLPFYTVASYFFFGEKAPIVIRKEPDFLDNYSLLGIKWEDMPEDFFYSVCKNLNVTTIVVSELEDKVIKFMERGNRFRLTNRIGSFLIYKPIDYKSNWLSFNESELKAEILSFKENYIKIRINRSAGNAKLILKVAYYPSWRGYIDNQEVALNQESQIGLIQITLPAKQNYDLELVYKYNLAEIIGWIITSLSLILYIFVAIWKQGVQKASF